MSSPIAVTCGDPAGVGPEIAVEAWRSLGRTIPLVWLGDPRHLPTGTPIFELSDISKYASAPQNHLPVLPIDFAAPSRPGHADLNNASGVVASIDAAVKLALSGAVSGICTAPIHKKVLMDGANFRFPGHTEYLAHLAGDADVVMMLASDTLRVVPTTIHIALSDVPNHLNPTLLEKTIRITNKGLQTQFGISEPRIAVAGLNPHAGEGGAMGREEIDWIADTVQRLASEGLDVSGPHSADTMFHARAREGYDAAVAMYHDQALIPIKTLDFDRGVNVTLGLPFIRTSPDHGTAFDIAGKGVANPTSMIEAIRMAWRMANSTQ